VAIGENQNNGPKPSQYQTEIVINFSKSDGKLHIKDPKEVLKKSKERAKKVAVPFGYHSAPIKLISLYILNLYLFWANMKIYTSK
jgi:hypothetical protein